MKKKSIPIALEDLKEGMICSQTICDNRGMILIGRGVKLTKAYIHGLQKFKVAVIDIQDEDQEEIKDSLKIINSKSQQLLHFIDSYRQIAELPKPKKTRINLRNIIEKVVKIFETEFKNQKIKMVGFLKT